MEKRYSSKTMRYKGFLLLTSALVLASLPSSVRAQDNTSEDFIIKEILEEQNMIEELPSYVIWNEVVLDISESGETDIELTKDLLIELTDNLLNEYLNTYPVKSDKETFIKLLTEKLKSYEHYGVLQFYFEDRLSNDADTANGEDSDDEISDTDVNKKPEEDSQFSEKIADKELQSDDELALPSNEKKVEEKDNKEHEVGELDIKKKDTSTNSPNNRDVLTPQRIDERLENLKNKASSGGASSRWHAAIEGNNLYPNEKAFHEQLNILSNRMLVLGMTEFRNKNYDEAMLYFNRVVNGPTAYFESHTVQEASDYKSEIEKLTNPLNSKESLLNRTVSGGASSRWHSAILGYELYPGEVAFHESLRTLSNRMFTFGKQEHEKGNFEGALLYYNRVTNGPSELFDSELVRQATELQKDAENNIRLISKETLIQQSNTGGASSRWHAATEGYRLYPEEVAFHESLRTLSNRMFTFGKQEHEKGNFEGALLYYNRVTNGPSELFDSELVRQATELQKDAENNIRLISKETLIQQSNTGGASSRWHAAVEGYRLYPEEVAFHNQLRFLSTRMMRLGMESHESKDWDGAALYYNRIIEGPNNLFETSLVSNARVYHVQANNNVQLLTLEMVKNTATTGGASSRWKSALEGYRWYSNNPEVINLVEITSNRILELGLEHHNKGEFREAVSYYNRFSNLDDTFSTLKSKARTNRYFAENNLYLVNSIYYSSLYPLSLESMLSEQMRRNPQTDLYGNGWQTAKENDVKYYLNPHNFINSLETEVLESQQVRISTSALNVRTQPSASSSLLGQVYQNDEFEIMKYENGWYQIKYGKHDGWISGAYVSLISKPKEISLENVIGRVTTSVLNVREQPTTNSKVLTTVSAGTLLEILDEDNEWLEVQIGDMRGWVHQAYITVEKSLNRSALQYLILSESLGIDVSNLNQLLVGKGILENQGKSFALASQQYDINEVYLISHALLETGNGKSSLSTGIVVNEVDGKPVEEKTVYNMFGIGAIDSSPLKGGSEYAYKQGWDTPEKAIIGGAEWIARQYVHHQTYKQDTLYKMRWNPSNPGVHQYATDIGWAYKQTRSLESLLDISLQNNIPLRFDIPFYH